MSSCCADVSVLPSKMHLLARSQKVQDLRLFFLPELRLDIDITQSGGPNTMPKQDHILFPF